MAVASDEPDIVELLRGLVYGEHVNHKAADIIETLREQIRVADRNYYDRGREIERLKEKLEMAQTEARDSDEFRCREKKHAEAVMTGMSLAIDAMVRGLKGK